MTFVVLPSSTESGRGEVSVSGSQSAACSASHLSNTISALLSASCYGAVLLRATCKPWSCARSLSPVRSSVAGGFGWRHHSLCALCELYYILEAQDCSVI